MDIRTIDGMQVAELFLDDLSERAKAALTEFLGDNGNYDVFPLAQIVGGECADSFGGVFNN